MALLILSLTLVALALAAPPPVNHSPNFRLVANVNSSGTFTTSIQNWVVSTHRDKACQNYAILAPNNTDPVRAFYVNGTPAEVAHKTSDILVDLAGSNPTPYGLVVSSADQTDTEGRRGLYIDCGAGTAGLSTRFPAARMPHLTYANKASGERFGAWYACNTTVPKDVVTLFFRNSSLETPAGCADVTLYPECLGSVSSVASNPEPGPCYESVASID